MSTKQSHGLIPRDRKPAHVPENSVTVQYGHTETKVVLIFSNKIDNLQLTPQQCVETMHALKKEYDALMAKIDG